MSKSAKFSLPLLSTNNIKLWLGSCNLVDAFFPVHSQQHNERSCNKLMLYSIRFMHAVCPSIGVECDYGGLSGLKYFVDCSIEHRICQL